MLLTLSTAPIGTIPAPPPMALRGKSLVPTLRARFSSGLSSISEAFGFGFNVYESPNVFLETLHLAERMSLMNNLLRCLTLAGCLPFPFGQAAAQHAPL